MRVTPLALLSVCLVTGMALAGCSAGGGSNGGTTDGDLDVTTETGGIRGVVVNQAIQPIAGVVVTMTGGKNATTAEDGAFTFTGLEAGDYFISAGKAGYRPAQVAAAVVAGEADPAVVRILLEAIATATPYLEINKLDGYYECGFALFFITDSCDFAYRTAYDGYNESAPSPLPRPLPLASRTLIKFANTQYITITQDTFSVVQEGFWDTDVAKSFWVSVDHTPIDNFCDCSDSYFGSSGAAPLLNRADRFDAAGMEDDGFPTDVLVASRGFLPFQETTEVAYAVNMAFTVMATLFHNYVPDPAWTFETRENFPLG